MPKQSKKKSKWVVKTQDVILQAIPGAIFPWPQGMVITALDEMIIEIPQAVFGEEPIGSVLLGSEDCEVCIPPHNDDSFFIRLQPGMSVSLTKSCEARLVAEEKTPRKVWITGTF